MVPLLKNQKNFEVWTDSKGEALAYCSNCGFRFLLNGTPNKLIDFKHQCSAPLDVETRIMVERPTDKVDLSNDLPVDFE